MTAVEWLVDYYKNLEIYPYKTFEELYEQAKEMEKQQIIDAWIATDNELQRIAAEQYYNETYGSKGSDDHIVDTNEMIYPKTAFEILQPKLTIADTLEFREKHLPEILDAMEEYATSSQTEISDEEIEKAAKEWYEKEGWVHYKAEIRAWVSACKWYREQLKLNNNLKLK